DLLSLPACPLSSSYFGSALGGSAALGATRGLPALLVGDDHASPEGRLYGGRILVISPRSLLSRFGDINAGAGPRTDSPFVNDSIGDVRRQTFVYSYVAFTVFLDVPPAAPGRAPFALYALVGAPRAIDVTPQPYRIGTAVFPTPLSGGSPQPVVV